MAHSTATRPLPALQLIMRRSLLRILRVRAAVLGAVIALAPSAWAAGQLCTMPNGVIIRMSTANCPRDAVKVVPDDGRELPANQVPIRRPEPERLKVTVTPVAPPPRPRPSPPAADKKRDLADEASEICVRLRSAGATTCKLNFNFFSASFIDATVATSPQNARMICLAVADKTRTPGSPFAGHSWELRLFSPLGNGTRPMAACRL